MDIIIYGAGGVMGQKLISKLSSLDTYIIKASVDPRDDKYLSSLNNFEEKADLIIDFSHPANLEDILEYAIEKEVPTLLCTTGYTDNQMDYIRKAGDTIPVLQAGNTSTGIAILKILLKTALSQLPGWDVELIEEHHNRKVDSPSGTAKELVNVIQTDRENTKVVYGRNPNSGKRSKEDIGMHSIRGGTVVGNHKIKILGEEEVIEINHKAISRDLFISGALRLAEFLHQRKPSFYTVEDAYK
ncbi:MAG: 4-hydroxy-tetrahydrodipicolinate reductase [Clostridia bacterium]